MYTKDISNHGWVTKYTILNENIEILRDQIDNLFLYFIFEFQEKPINNMGTPRRTASNA